MCQKEKGEMVKRYFNWQCAWGNSSQVIRPQTIYRQDIIEYYDLTHGVSEQLSQYLP